MTWIRRLSDVIYSLCIGSGACCLRDDDAASSLCVASIWRTQEVHAHTHTHKSKPWNERRLVFSPPQITQRTRKERRKGRRRIQRTGVRRLRHNVIWWQRCEKRNRYIHSSQRKANEEAGEEKKKILLKRIPSNCSTLFLRCRHTHEWSSTLSSTFQKMKRYSSAIRVWMNLQRNCKGLWNVSFTFSQVYFVANG